MTTFIGLLRAINVGGTGKLPMADLRRLCEGCGFTSVRTYIASGNVVFDCDAPEDAVRARLEQALLARMGKPVGVVLRDAEDLRRVLAHNPFAHLSPTHTVAIFMNEVVAEYALQNLRHLTVEQPVLGHREIYVHYPEGQGRSKLVIPAAREGTARNMNTVQALVEMAQANG
jgi:uncharacterized protein (DUF1697 family)